MNQNSVPANDAIGRLVEEFSKLPGIGPKSAQRITFHLLRSADENSRSLAEAILSLKQRISLCSVCCNVTESDPCPICRNQQRDTGQVCIVEQPQDILALEHTGENWAAEWLDRTYSYSYDTPLVFPYFDSLHNIRGLIFSLQILDRLIGRQGKISNFLET